MHYRLISLLSVVQWFTFSAGKNEIEKKHLRKKKKKLAILYANMSTYKICEVLLLLCTFPWFVNTHTLHKSSTFNLFIKPITKGRAAKHTALPTTY